MTKRGEQMPKNIKDFFKERDAEKILSAREAEQVMRPIIAFARGHMSHTQSLIAKWPDLCNGEERTEAVRLWLEQLNPRIERSLDEWFQKDRSPILRSEYIAACFREAIAQFLGCDARSNAPQAKLWRERFSSRAVEIADVITTNLDTSLAEIQFKDIIIILIPEWTQHGAHFPDT